MIEEIIPRRMLLLCGCAALEARGDLQRLDVAIRKALDGGVGVNELKDAFAQLYAYTGFPRSLNALNTLERVLSERETEGIADHEGKPFQRPAAWDDAKLALQLGTAMQTRAILGAACQLKKEGYDPHPEIMVPLIGILYELKQQKEIIQRVAEEVFAEEGVRIDFEIGTMIEIPRAALTADRIATEAEYFSFGTNDLTQMTFGYSRDDIASFLPVYLEKKILKVDPFQVLDQNGVGKLIKMAVENGRKVRPNLRTGICGEHGGEPSSVKFCAKVGMNYASCSPFRVPIARLAAAQAAVEE